MAFSLESDASKGGRACGGSACGAAGQWEMAEEAFRRRRQAGVSGSRPLYDALLQAYLTAGQWQQALHLLKHMAQRGENPSTSNYTTFLRLVSSLG